MVGNKSTFSCSVGIYPKTCCTTHCDGITTGYAMSLRALMPACKRLQSYCRLWCSIQRTRVYFFCFVVIIMWLTILYLSSQTFLSAHCIVQLTLWIYFCLLPLQLNATLISLQASLFVINADSMYVRHILKRLELLQFILLPIYIKKIKYLNY